MTTWPLVPTRPFDVERANAWRDQHLAATANSPRTPARDRNNEEEPPEEEGPHARFKKQRQ